MLKALMLKAPVKMNIQNRQQSRIVQCLALCLSVLCIAQSGQAQGLIWSRNYGGKMNESGADIVKVPGGGYLALGSTFSFGGGDHDVYALRLDEFGDTLWSKTYGGPGTEYGYGVWTTSDGGFVTVGMARSTGAGKGDMFLTRLDSLGAEMWSKTFGGPERDEGWSVRQTPDGGFIIAGVTGSFGAGLEDFYLVKTDSTGALQWEKTFGGSGGDWADAVRVTADSGYILIGTTTSFGEGYSSVYVIRLTQAGNVLWANTYGGIKSELGTSIEQTSDGGFIFAGATASFSEDFNDVYVVKIDAAGSLLWENHYGGAFDERGYAIVELADGGFMVSGTTETFGSGKIDVYLLRLDSSGWMIWSATYGGAESDFCRSMILDDNRNPVILGHSYTFSSGGSDMYLIKVEGDITTDVQIFSDPTLPDGFALGQNYPNPFNPETNIPFSVPRATSVKVTALNILGQVVATLLDSRVSPGLHIIRWDGRTDAGASLASGVYFYRLQFEGKSYTQKMLLIK